MGAEKPDYIEDRQPAGNSERRYQREWQAAERLNPARSYSPTLLTASASSPDAPDDPRRLSRVSSDAALGHPGNGITFEDGWFEGSLKIDGSFATSRRITFNNSLVVTGKA